MSPLVVRYKKVIMEKFMLPKKDRRKMLLSVIVKKKKRKKRRNFLQIYMLIVFIEVDEKTFVFQLYTHNGNMVYAHAE